MMRRRSRRISFSSCASNVSPSRSASCRKASRVLTETLMVVDSGIPDSIPKGDRRRDSPTLIAVGHREPAEDATGGRRTVCVRAEAADQTNASQHTKCTSSDVISGSGWGRFPTCTQNTYPARPSSPPPHRHSFRQRCPGTLDAEAATPQSAVGVSAGSEGGEERPIQPSVMATPYRCVRGRPRGSTRWHQSRRPLVWLQHSGATVDRSP